MKTILATLILVGSAVLAAPSAEAQITRTERITFPPGAVSAAVPGQIVGYEEAGYELGAEVGQRMVVTMTATNASANFNIFAPGDRPGEATALFSGSVEGRTADITLPESGDYLVQVFLERSAARRDEKADYDLAFTIEAGAPDFADGLSGGPDWWAVSGVAAGDRLNIRSGPGTGNAVIGQVSNGAPLRDLGCEMQGQRWCRVETADRGTQGWVAGRFLVEGRAP